MKYLLKQSIDFKTDTSGLFIELFPNNFSRSLVREANKKKLILSTSYTYRYGYKAVHNYLFFRHSFLALLDKYQKKIQTKRDKFYKKKPLTQLILVLKYIFQRNIRAKEVFKRSAKYKAYDDKEDFLRIALDIAKEVRYKQFSYGWEEDVHAINYEYVYYFQLKDKQVSFHSSKLYLDVPEFQGTWTGIRNTDFPLKIK